MITGKQQVEISGPIGIVHIVGETARHGVPQLLILAVILNINLGLLNLACLCPFWTRLAVDSRFRSNTGQTLGTLKRAASRSLLVLALLIMLMLFATFKDLAASSLFS